MAMKSSETQVNRGRPKDVGKHQAILEAASMLFLAGGFHSTSMEALAREANVSKATLYSHFVDKAALYRALIEAKMVDYKVDDFSNMLNWDVAQDLHLIANHMLDLIFDPEALDMLRMVISEGRSESDVVALFDEVGPRRVFAQISDYLERQKARGTKYIDDIEADTALFTSLVVDHRSMLFALMGLEPGPDTATRERMARTAVARFIKLKRAEQAF